MEMGREAPLLMLREDVPLPTRAKVYRNTAPRTARLFFFSNRKREIREMEEKNSERGRIE